MPRFIKDRKNGRFGITQAPPLMQVAYILVCALVLTLSIEALARHSPLAALAFALQRPAAFLYNALLIAFALSFAMLLKRRLFLFALVLTVWMGLSLANFIITFVRITPLNSYDFVIFFQNLSILKAYMSPVELLLAGLLLLFILHRLLLIFLRAPKARPNRRFALILCAVMAAVTMVATTSYSLLCRDYEDPIKAYKEYGFAYSLLRSVFDRGIARPSGYDEEKVEEILGSVEEPPSPAAANRPNIIFLQLESFLDPANILGVGCSRDPVPCFTRLKESCVTGDLKVPMIGGGTANVEFEIISGMNLADFGTGEYPYTSILQNDACETIAFDLKKLGYRTHAIHNHNATFYRRDEVYPRLGFDTFTPLEYMSGFEKNALGWCKDEVLTGCILDALAATPGRDFIFAISVQAHGAYPGEPPEAPYPITSSGLEEEPVLKNQFEYYINEIHSVDAFLEDLIECLENFDEPVVLAVYGDHLPALGFEAEDLASGSMLTTEYAIWRNDSRLTREERDLAAFQLAARTLELCGIGEGTLVSYHQQRNQEPDYLENLAVLEYDMLYGDKVIYDGEPAFRPVNMRMGVAEVQIDRAEQGNGILRVYGSRFTPYSVVYARGKALDTRFVDAETLIAAPTLLSGSQPGDPITVCQVSNDGTILGRSNEVVCEALPAE